MSRYIMDGAVMLLFFLKMSAWRTNLLQSGHLGLPSMLPDAIKNPSCLGLHSAGQ